MSTLLETTRKLVIDLKRIGFGDPHTPINGGNCVDVINDHYADLEAAFVEYDPEKEERNRRLLDAAPDLLAALEDFLKIDTWHDEDIAPARMVLAAEAAIAKATGRTPLEQTNTRPTAPGWYWYWQQNAPDHKAEPVVVRLYRDHGGCIRFHDCGVNVVDTPVWCKWAGPITPELLEAKVEVIGGVAHLTKCPAGVTVEIQDHDNEKHQ